MAQLGHEDRFRAWLEKRTEEHGERQALSSHLRRQRNFVTKYLSGQPKTLPLDDAVEIARYYKVSLDAVMSHTPPRSDPEFSKLVTALASVADQDAWTAIRLFVQRFLPQRGEAAEPRVSPRDGKGRKGRGSR